jgi:putative addiction module component (TIGR02574 family)
MSLVNARVREVLDAALALSPEDRELLMDELASRTEAEAEGHAVDEAEIERRLEDYLAGRAKAVDGDEMLARLRARYSAR